MRRSLSIVLLALSTLLVTSQPASAGGSWLRPDRNAYVPGELATVRGSFSRGSLEGTFADGPYVAYLLREGRSMLGTVRVPAAAIRLGELRIIRSDGRSGLRAIATFRVPDVTVGWYHVDYCNDPCTVDGIGDLIGSSRFVIAPTRLEGQHIVVVDRLEQRMAGVRRDVAIRTRGEREKLERALEARTVELGEADARTAILETQLANRPVEQASQDRILVPGWAVVVLAMALVAAAVVLARRRAPAFVVPDTVPDDLLERDRADV